MAIQIMPKTCSIFFLLANIIVRSQASTPNAPRNHLSLQFQRRETSSCKDVDSSLPDNFSCPSTTFCISTDSSSSALCCPRGGDCSKIQVINCDVKRQDPSVFDDTTIFTTKLDTSLPTCGNNCCPFGYTCNDSSNNGFSCDLILETSRNGSVATSSAPSSSTSTTSATSSSTSTSTVSSTASATTTALSSGIDSTQPQPSVECNVFPAGVFLAGFFPGILVGALIMLGWVICTGRHRKDWIRNSKASSASSYKPVISDPIPLMSGGARTDFLRRTTTRAKSMFSTKGSPRIDSNPWKNPTPPVPNNIPPRPLGLPVTPTPKKINHAPSTESIKVYSPSVTQPATAAVAPIRRLASQQNASQSGFGSPFQTPPNPNLGVNRDNEMLTPKKYEGGRYGNARQNTDAGRSRPETTFTDMMVNTGFERPIPQRPPMPPIPKGYDSTNQI